MDGDKKIVIDEVVAEIASLAYQRTNEATTRLRNTGHLYRLRRWPEGFPGSYRGGLPESSRAVVHRAHGTAQPELRVVEAAC